MIFTPWPMTPHEEFPHCSPVELLTLGYFTDDFGVEQDILYAPNEVLIQWQYFLDSAI